MSKNTGASVVIQKRYVVIAAVIALLLIACGIVIGLNWQSWFGAQDDPPTSQTVTPDISPQKTAPL